MERGTNRSSDSREFTLEEWKRLGHLCNSRLHGQANRQNPEVDGSGSMINHQGEKEIV
jgi:hypothetical protein